MPGRPASPRPAHAPAPQHVTDKWAVLRDLGLARRAFGLRDRDLSLLQALMSFHPDQSLRETDNLIVFPSNRSLSARAHGMAESTLRRRLGVLIEAGLLQRHDSPNGKRYAVRGDIEAARVFGFDLRPLLLRAAEIAEAARMERARQAECRRLREAISLALRDIEVLSGAADEDAMALIAQARREIRRKLDVARLTEMHDSIETWRADILPQAEVVETTEMSGSDARNERHIQDSDIIKIESLEPETEARNGTIRPATQQCEIAQSKDAGRPSAPQDATLEQVIKICPEVTHYLPSDLRHWHQYVAALALVANYIGIDAATWAHAQRKMGPENAAITVSAILQSLPRIAKPGAYLRSLAGRFAEGTFRPSRMLGALSRAKVCAS